MLRLERLHLKNLRGFAELELDFSPKGSTVIVGVNGAGKTTVLVAIAELLAKFASDLLGSNYTAGLIHERDNLRAGASSSTCKLELSATPPFRMSSERIGLTFLFELELNGAVTRLEDAARFPSAKQWRKLLQDFPWKTPVPVMAYYPVDRDVHNRGAPPSYIPLLSQLAAYVGAFDPSGANFADFVEWFIQREDLENEQIRDRADYRDPVLAAIRAAISVFVGAEFASLRARRGRGRVQPALVVNRDGVELSLHQLSHGERGLLALAGDIARRLAMTHPGLKDPLQGHGVVLIDEIELHLHPQWQRKVIPSLERTFPNVQFVLTTHSPQVLSLVRPEQLRILDGFSLVAGAPHTYGRDSNSILYEVMGVEQYPPFAAERVRKVSQLIDEERWDEARRELDALSKDFGSGDAEVVRLGSMLEVLRDDGDPA